VLIVISSEYSTIRDGIVYRKTYPEGGFNLFYLNALGNIDILGNYHR
jgi:hypothetical protein